MCKRIRYTYKASSYLAMKEHAKIFNQMISYNCSQWRFIEVSTTFLVLSIHHEEPLPARAVKAIVNGLVHDALAIRKVAV